MERNCKNCKHKKWRDWDGWEYCLTYEMHALDNCAEDCEGYEYHDWTEQEQEERENYTPSATAGDYSPSCPWNAPGMSIHDFI